MGGARCKSAKAQADQSSVHGNAFLHVNTSMHVNDGVVDVEIRPQFLQFQL